MKLPFVDDTVHLKNNLILDHTTAGARTLLHCDGNKPPTSTKQPFFKGTALRSLFEAPLHWSPQPNPLLPMVCYPFQNKWGLQIPKVQSEAFPVMQMYLSLSSSYIIPRFMTEVHHDLSLLWKPRRNANFPYVHSPLRHLGTPLMQSKVGRSSKAFDHCQPNKKSSKNSHPILKMIRKGLVELK